SIAAGDLENNGNPDIVVSSFNHEITAFRPDGSVFWRFNNDDTVFSGVAIGDLNRDGRLEVVVGGDSAPSQFYWAGGRIDCLSWEGKREWVVQTDQVIWSAPVLADLLGNGQLDVVFADFTGNLYAVAPSGQQIWKTAAFPGQGLYGSPIVGPDITGNGHADVFLGAVNGGTNQVVLQGFDGTTGTSIF